MTDRTVRVVIADDHGIVREGIRTVLEHESDIDVVAEAANAADAIALVKQHAPDVLVLDVSLPDRSGLEVAAALRGTDGAPRVLMLSVYDDRQYVIEAVRAGAQGYVLKDSAPADLRAAVRAVHAGDNYYSPSVARHLGAAVRDGDQQDDAAARLARLTERERDVLRLIASGHTHKETAARLGISHRTVETHRENLVRKLGVRSVAELTRIALETGLLDD